jgi:hypothetical protein
MQCPLPRKEIAGPRAAAKIDVIRAATHRHVLTMVDCLVCRAINVRSGPSAELFAGLKQLNL